jgi:hypothetical protein
VQAHPALVRTVIAHEPPLNELLADREQLRAQIEDTIATYLDGNVAGAWGKFLAAANITVPEGALQQMYGGERDPQQVADERFWFAREMRGTARWQPDLAALRSAGTRVVVGIGADSAGQICDRTSRRSPRPSARSRRCSPAATSASSRTPPGSPPGYAPSGQEVSLNRDMRQLTCRIFGGSW